MTARLSRPGLLSPKESSHATIPKNPAQDKSSHATIPKNPAQDKTLRTPDPNEKACASNRIPRTAKRVTGASQASEEILASLLGAMICNHDIDRLALLAKATAELLDRGQSLENASRQVQEL